MFLKILRTESAGSHLYGVLIFDAKLSRKQTLIKRLKTTYYMVSRKMNERLKSGKQMQHLIFSFSWDEVMGLQMLKARPILQYFFG